MNFGIILSTCILVLVQIVLLGFAMKCLRLTKNKDIKKVSGFLKKFMIILLIIVSVSFVISFIGHILEYIGSKLIYIIIISMLIDFFFIIMVSNYAIKIIKNLKEDKIYVKDNANYLLELSRTFIYYSLVTGISGIVSMVFINILDSGSFTTGINIDFNFFFNLLLGFVFYVIYLLFERSIEIYEENELTI